LKYIRGWLGNKFPAKHIERHRRKDERGEADEEFKERYEERRKELKRQIEKIGGFLEGMEKKTGKRGQEIRSNVTDNESALIMSGGSYIQGYIGIAVADQKNQIIVSAEAAGSANESEHFPDMLDQTLDNLRSVTEGESDDTKETILADNNYFGEDNLRAAEERDIEAIMPDKEYKRRLGNKVEKERYGREDFKYQEEENCYECPGGKNLEYKGEGKVRGAATKEYAAGVIDCRGCPCQGKCIKRKDGKGELKTGRRLIKSRSNEEGALCGEMKAKMSTEAYQERYAYRIGIIEPVFSDIGYCKGLDRFTLRGREKVNAQWQLYCMVHNLWKALKAYNKRRSYA
jgi:IS5 family transposase